MRRKTVETGMAAVSVKTTKTLEDGRRVVDAFIIADETPDKLPETGDGIVGLLKSDIFAPMSILYVVGEDESKVYIADGRGLFVAQ